MPEMQDPIGVEDSLRVVLRGEDGQIKHPEDVKGPDPAVWGDNADRPDPFEGAADAGIPVGEWRDDLEEKNTQELRELASDYGITGRSKGDLIDTLKAHGIGVTKGPGPEWEQNEKGEYVNR